LLAVVIDASLSVMSAWIHLPPILCTIYCFTFLWAWQTNYSSALFVDKWEENQCDTRTLISWKKFTCMAIGS